MSPIKSLGFTPELVGRLEARKGENPYWEKAYQFVMDVREKPLDSLTLRQRNWLVGILDDLKGPWEV